MQHGGAESLRFARETRGIIGACIEVHRHLGPGLLESAYERALAFELETRGIRFERQVEVPARYKGIDLGTTYRADLVVEGRVIVELKAVDALLPVHDAQLVTYLRLLRVGVGLLVNFHVPRLKEGVRRFLLTDGTSLGRSASP